MTSTPKTRAVNLARGEVCDVYAGRATSAHAVPPGTPGSDGYFGNPVLVGSVCPVCRVRHQDPGSTIPCFRRYFESRLLHDPTYRLAVEGLRGKRLGCFCAPKECHCDVYVEHLEQDNQTEDEVVEELARTLAGGRA